MPVPLFHVDAFADCPFSGNPAAVCLLPSWKDDRWLQAVGREMNLSETAFLVRNADGFDLRWFTPKAEVDLCGHATLASAHVLWQQNLANPGDVLRFSTRSGLLKAVRKGDAIDLDFPLEPDASAEPPDNLLSALGVSAQYVGKNRFDYVVEVESEQVLRRVAPDFKLLGMVPCRGVIVTSRSADPQFDFVSRAFFPRLGVDEDPVCGSAHCCLGPFWQRRTGKNNFVAYQASARGGVVTVRLARDRAFLGGKAVIVAKGELMPGT
jgi:PhzF family phenazine biosynthesis protein